MTDGNLATRWASAELSGTVWLTLDLKGEKTFNCIDVCETEGYKGRIDKVVVSVSDNGIDWKRWMGRRPLNVSNLCWRETGGALVEF